MSTTHNCKPIWSLLPVCSLISLPLSDTNIDKWISDVVYDADLIPALTATVRNLLVAGRHGTDGKPSAIVACTVRNEETGQLFLNEIGRFNF